MNEKLSVGTDPHNKLYAGKTVAKNTIYNLVGYGFPLILAVFLIPILIDGLGEERFGLLNLAWVVIGYFSLFDFGIGRALTKIISEKIGSNQNEEIPSLFWTSFYIMLGLSLIGTSILLFSASWLINDIFNISKELKPESLNTFYVLAFSIPIVTTTAGLRGTLESYQKFALINIIRSILGVFTFLGPLLCLYFTNSLFWIVLFLTLIRIIMWVLYFIPCLKLIANLKNGIKFDARLIKPIFKLSGWITVTNIVGPLLIYLDRFLIGAILTATAITYYATPYEMVTKLLIIPNALIGVLFPAFSTSFIKNPEISKGLLIKGIKSIFIILFPITIVIITFSFEIMSLWLGDKFAFNSFHILQFLALGVLINSIGFIPFTFLQGVGKPDIPAKVNLLELPFYIFFMLIAIKYWGLIGAALVWALRVFVDTLVLLYFARKIVSRKINFKYTIFFSILAIVLFIPFFLTEFYFKILFCVLILLAFCILSWKYLLHPEEKKILIAGLKKFY